MGEKKNKKEIAKITLKEYLQTLPRRKGSIADLLELDESTLTNKQVFDRIKKFKRK